MPPARVPHTTKRPERCPHCGSVKLVRRGTRAKKSETVQLWQCRACTRAFTPAPPALRHRAKRLDHILNLLQQVAVGSGQREGAQTCRFGVKPGNRCHLLRPLGCTVAKKSNTLH
jgi:transposase-like protein